MIFLLCILGPIFAEKRPVLGQEMKPALQELCRLLSSGSDDECLRASLIIPDLGPYAGPCTPFLKARLRNATGQLALALAEAVRSIGSSAAVCRGELLSLLSSSENPQVRKAAIRALASVGPTDGRDQALTRTLVQCLEEEHPGLRLSAAAALLLFGQVSEASQVLAIAMNSSDVGVTRTALRELLVIGPHTDAIVPALAKGCQSTDRYTRANSAWAIGNCQTPSDMALQILRGLCQDRDVLVRTEAARSLWMLTGSSERPLEILRSVITSEPVELDKMHAVAVLGLLFENSEPGKALLRKLVSEDTALRRASARCAAIILAKNGETPQTLVPAMRRDLQSEEWYVRFNRLRSIARAKLRLRFARDLEERLLADEYLGTRCLAEHLFR
jgi:HEAT repeat protein